MADDDAPATQRDLARVEGRLDKLDGRLDKLDGRLEKMHADLREQIRDMQTEILKAFLPWQQGVNVQFQELRANTGNSVQAINQRMDAMERRLWEIEKKLLMNPPAA